MKHIINPLAVVNGVICYSEAELQNVINTYTLPTRWTVMSRGAHFVLVGDDAGGGGEIVTPEYQAILDYATGQGYTLPSAGNQSAQNALVAELLDDGIWTDLDVFYNFYTDGDASFAGINWKAPGTGNIIPVGTPLFTALSGYSKNGVNTNALNTQFVPSAGVKFTDAECGVFIDSTVATADGLHARYFDVCDAVDVNRTSLAVLAGTAGAARFRAAVNASVTSNGTNLAIADTDGTGFIHVQRIAAGVQAFKDGAQTVTNNAQVAATRPGFAVNLFVVNTGGTNAPGTTPGLTTNLACFGMGASLTGKESILFNAWTTYKANA